MSYYTRVYNDGSLRVYDPPFYLGSVTGPNYTAVHALRRTGPTFATQDDAVLWLVEEHRDIPWADRDVARRISAPD